MTDGGIRQVEPDWTGWLIGFTLLFEALIMAMCREMNRAVGCAMDVYREVTGTRA